MKNKGERGAITLFVSVVCIFVMIMLMTYSMRIENKKQTQSKEIEEITKSYQQNEQQMEQIYANIINQ